MRTSLFKEALEWVARRMLGTSAAMGDDDAAAYVDFLTTAVRAGWEYAFWPEWTVTEERYFRAAWSSATAYTAGAEVFYVDAYYRALLSSTNVAPGTDATKWEACGVDSALPLRAYVSLDQVGKTAIGEVDEVFARDPRVYGEGGKLGWQRGVDGIEFHGSSPAAISTTTATCGVAVLPNSVWVRFRLRPPVFTSTNWASGTTYAVGDRVYYPTTGECYLALLSSTGTAPGSDVTKWVKIDFPYVIAEAVKMLAYAEALEDDGQVDKASGKRTEAEGQLAIEWLKCAGDGQSRRAA